MLKPEYFQDKADGMIELYRQLEDYILNDIAARLLKSQSVPGTADRLLWKLEQMGESRAEIMKKLSQITGLSRRELQALLQDAVITSWKDDLSTFNKMGIQITNPLENAAVMSVMDAEYKKSQGELENLTRTAMEQSNKDLIRMLDEVEMRVASGIQSYSSAVCEVLDNYAGTGVVVNYPSGTKRTLEAAVRACIVTSMNQTSAQITNQYIVEAGAEYVLVSAHLGARTQSPGQPYLAGHDNWQGKVYKIRGSDPGIPNLLEMTGYDIDENGMGKVVNPLGLHGYNCQHSHQAWDKDLENPYVDENGKLRISTEENSKRYKEKQRQRAMERAIRKTKRQLLVKQREIDGIAETDVKEILQMKYDKLAYRLRSQNKAYNEYCEEKDLQKQYDRLKVAGFKRKQAAKASGRARAYENWQKKETVVKKKAEVPRQNTVGRSKIRSEEELLEVALNVEKEIKVLTDRNSKWSGKISVDNNKCDELKISGQKEWECSILLHDAVDDGTIIHEMLHAYSMSHYGKVDYIRYGATEEAVVELLSREICAKKGIATCGAYDDYVSVLKTINSSMRFAETDYEFALMLFNMEPSDRYTWIHNNVSEYLKVNNASVGDIVDVMEYIKILGDIEI